MKFYNTLIPYKVLPHYGIQYDVCRDFHHISRYRKLRQLSHNPKIPNIRFVALETSNPIVTHTEIKYYEVQATEVNRLDLISQKLLGSPTYAWILAYFNNIEDGFSVYQGQILKHPTSPTALFAEGEVLSPVNPFALNLSEE